MLKTNSFFDTLVGELPKDTITTIYGPPGCGKSTICFQYIAACVKENKHVFYLDTEGGFSSERLKQIYPEIDFEKITVYDIKTFEEQEKSIKELHKGIKNAKKVGLIIIDSLVMLYRLHLGDSPKEINAKLANQLALLTEIARSFHIPILVTNQVYTSFETKETNLVGGSLARYWSKTLIELEKNSEYGKATLRKHRSKKEGESFNFEITNEGLKQSNLSAFSFLKN